MTDLPTPEQVEEIREMLREQDAPGKPIHFVRPDVIRTLLAHIYELEGVLSLGGHLRPDGSLCDYLALTGPCNKCGTTHPHFVPWNDQKKRADALEAELQSHKAHLEYMANGWSEEKEERDKDLERGADIHIENRKEIRRLKAQNAKLREAVTELRWSLTKVVLEDADEASVSIATEALEATDGE